MSASSFIDYFLLCDPFTLMSLSMYFYFLLSAQLSVMIHNIKKFGLMIKICTPLSVAMFNHMSFISKSDIKVSAVNLKSIHH